MCGLVGVVGKIDPKELQAFYWLLHMDVIRGPHSTGVAGVHREGEKTEYTLSKSLGLPEQLYWDHPEVFVNDIYSVKNPVCLIGHNRFATQGGVTVENAHPFEYEHVVGAHNGTVQQFSLRTFHDFTKLKVDSQIIYSELNHSNDVQKIWDAADGAMALTWWDKRDNSFHVARNKQRPLCFARHKHKETIFWASEAWMLNVVLGRLNILHEEVKEFTVDTHYTISFENHKINIDRKKLSPFVEKWAPVNYGTHYGSKGNQIFSSPASSGHNGGPALPEDKKEVFLKILEYNNTGLEEWEGCFFGVLEEEGNKEIRISIQGRDQKIWYENVMQAVKDKRPYFSVKKNSFYNMYNMTNVHVTNMEHRKNIVSLKGTKDKTPLNNYVKGYEGELLDKKKFEAACKTGCSVCMNPLSWEKAKEYVFLDKDMIVCQECKEDDWVKDLVSESFSLKN